MLKKSLRLVPLIAALFTVSLPAQAADYRVVVPAPGKAAPYAGIKLEMNPATLPTGLVGDPFAGFDFNTALRITGDPELDMSQVAWSVYSGALPAGLSLSREGGVYGTPTEIGKSSFQAFAKYKTKTALGTYTVGINDITLALDAVLPQAQPLKTYSYSLATQLSVDGDPNYTPEAVAWSLIDGTLPSGLSLTAAGEISGTPTVDGVYPITVLASYNGRSISKELQLDVVWTDVEILATDGTRHWEDGTYAQSCNDYIQPTSPYVYVGATGDGVYRIAPGGSPMDVYCDMTKDGGGWTLLMKQAKGDGVTLQGDSTYWKNGTTLNDNLSSLNIGDGNFVSAAFSALPTTQFILQASNESTMQKHTNDSSMTALDAFSDANMSKYSDPIYTWQPAAPNWSIHATTYPNGLVLSSARFGFNFAEIWLSYPEQIRCAVRWGWSGNQDGEGSHDVCGGLGAWGLAYGGPWSNNNKGAWQPATYYLWGK